MKKVNTILIVIVYIAAIVVISIFGLKAKVYKENIPVTSIECLNENDEANGITVKELSDRKLITVTLKESGDTTLLLNYRVLPDNASIKTVVFQFDREKYGDIVTPVTDEKGHEIGMFIFSKKVVFDMKISSTDGTGISTIVKIWVK